MTEECTYCGRIGCSECDPDYQLPSGQGLRWFETWCEECDTMTNHTTEQHLAAINDPDYRSEP